MKRRDLMALIAGAAAWPIVVRAQERRRVPKVGVLWHAADKDGEWPYYGCLLDGFEELGYTSGKIELIHRFPDEKPELFQSMAAELVALAPDVLVGVGGAAPYVKKATSTIPMVFMYVADPIGAKLVDSIRHPGGNATGLTNFGLELLGKRLEYLKEINPQLTKAAMMVNPTNPISNFYIKQSDAAGPKLGLTCKPYNVGTLDDLQPAFDAMVRDGTQAVLFNAESLFFVGRKKIAELALARKIAVLRLCEGSPGGWPADLLRRGPAPDRAPHRLLCRPHPERRKAGGHAGRAANRLPALHQSQHRKGARTHHFPHATRPSRRSD